MRVLSFFSCSCQGFKADEGKETGASTCNSSLESVGKELGTAIWVGAGPEGKIGIGEATDDYEGEDLKLKMLLHGKGAKN